MRQLVSDFVIFGEMSAVERSSKVSREAYLAYLDAADRKAEYLDGMIYDMAGRSLAHGQLAINFAASIHGASRGQGCRVFSSDVKVEIAGDGSIVFPDLSVVCGPVQTPSDRKDILLNPILIVEVLSPDRAAYDRGGKFMKYATIPSLREYVLVEQTHPSVDIFYRTESWLWDIRSHPSMDGVVTLRSISVEFPLRDLYRDVELGLG